MPKLTPNTGTPVPGEAAQRVQDRAVAAEHEAEIGVAPALGESTLGGRRRAWLELLRGRRPARQSRLGRAAAASAASVRQLGVREGHRGDQRRCGRPRPHRSPPAIAASRSSSGSRLRRTRRRSRGCPSGRAARRRRSREPARPSSLGRARDQIASRRSAAVADDAAPDPLAAELELRLDHRQRLAARPRQQAATAGRILVSEMKETSTVASQARREGRPGRGRGR